MPGLERSFQPVPVATLFFRRLCAAVIISYCCCFDRLRQRFASMSAVFGFQIQVAEPAGGNALRRDAGNHEVKFIRRAADIYRIADFDAVCRFCA